ncbi:hypothetical protein ZWY2020_044888 [Hordeum vulgare]|nr:hypothetical protein ZWY2020_044888 [Hordeum vulgare]
MEAAVGAASSLLGKVLTKLSEDLVAAYVDSLELGHNSQQIKTKLLYTQGLLQVAQGRDASNVTALQALLEELSKKADEAEDVLDELHYFKIQDQLDGTHYAASDLGDGIRGHARHGLHALRYSIVNLKELEVWNYSGNSMAADLLSEVAMTKTMQEGSFQLEKLHVNSISAVLVAPICNHLSTTLHTLAFYDDMRAKGFTEEQENALQLLTSLRTLGFIRCNVLQCLPRGLRHLSSLEALQAPLLCICTPICQRRASFCSAHIFEMVYYSVHVPQLHVSSGQEAGLSIYALVLFLWNYIQCACQFGLKSTNKMKKSHFFLSFNEFCSDHLKGPRFKSASLQRNQKSKEKAVQKFPSHTHIVWELSAFGTPLLKLKSDNVSCVRSGAPLNFLHVDEPIPQACFEVQLPGESVTPR